MKKSIPTKKITILLGFLLLSGTFVILYGHSNSQTNHKFLFEINYIDSKYGGTGKPGWVRAADIDRDGRIEIVAGGGRALFIYKNNYNSNDWDWIRFGNLDGTEQMGANGAVLYDVDRDGDDDVVSAKYYGDIGWWENSGGSVSNTKWEFHPIIRTDWFLHDLIVADLDQDGKSEEFIATLNNKYWHSDIKIIVFRSGNDPKKHWIKYAIEAERNEGDRHNHSGLDTGDINQDGIVDLAFSNGWYKAPENPTDAWTWHPVSDIYGISNTLLRDMDGDGDLDLIVSAGHHGRGVYWYENRLGYKKNEWIRHIVDSAIIHPEGLAAADIDADGDIDIVVCDLDFERWDQKVHNVYIFENQKKSQRWTKHNIAPNSFPSHKLQLTDVNSDGLMDVLSESAGYKVVSYYENISNVP